jgi:hypothetical protein
MVPSFQCSMSRAFGGHLHLALAKYDQAEMAYPEEQRRRKRGGGRPKAAPRRKPQLPALWIIPQRFEARKDRRNGYFQTLLK